VQLGGVDADIVQGDNADRVIVQAVTNTGSAGFGNVHIQADSGALVTLADGWRYLVDGAISSATPATGQLGTVVTIGGARLLGGGTSPTSVTLAGSAANVQSFSATRIIVDAIASSASNGAGAIVITSDTGAVVTRSNIWTYAEQGAVLTTDPASGQHGTTVVVSGTNLLGHGQSLTSITLAGVGAEVVGVPSNTEITVTAGLSGAAEGLVTITVNTGAVVSSTENWVYPAPGEITGASPDSGQYGTRVTISGSNLLGHGSSLDEVLLAGVEVETIYSQSNDEVVVRAAAGPSEPESGSISVTVNAGAIVTVEDAWSYLRPATIENVQPSSGRVGSVVTVFGVNLCGGGSQVAGVTLAGFDATLTNVESCSLLAVEANDFGSAAIGAVVVISDSGAETRVEDAWTYLVEGEITGVTPNAGQTNTIVTVTGTSLLGGGSSAASVSLAGRDAFVQSSSNTEVVIRAFEGPADGGLGDIVIVGNTGVTVRLVDGFTYSGTSSVVPDHGNRGTLITVTGLAMFAGGTGITELRLAGVEVDQIVSSSSTEIVVTASFENVLVDQTGAVDITLDNGQLVDSGECLDQQDPGAYRSCQPVKRAARHRCRDHRHRAVGIWLGGHRSYAWRCDPGRGPGGHQHPDRRSRWCKRRRGWRCGDRVRQRRNCEPRERLELRRNCGDQQCVSRHWSAQYCRDNHRQQPTGWREQHNPSDALRPAGCRDCQRGRVHRGRGGRLCQPVQHLPNVLPPNLRRMRRTRGNPVHLVPDRTSAGQRRMYLDL
jgi:hypothetical protein